MNRHTGLPAVCALTVVILWGRPMPPRLKRALGSPVASDTVWEYGNALQANKPVFVYRQTATPQIGLDDPQLDEKRTQFPVSSSYLYLQGYRAVFHFIGQEHHPGFLW